MGHIADKLIKSKNDAEHLRESPNQTELLSVCQFGPRNFPPLPNYCHLSMCISVLVCVFVFVYLYVYLYLRI